MRVRSTFGCRSAPRKEEEHQQTLNQLKPLRVFLKFSNIARCSFDFCDRERILFEFYSFGGDDEKWLQGRLLFVCYFRVVSFLFTLARTALNNRVNSRKKIIKFHGRDGKVRTR